MASETIFVLDADSQIDQRITDILEADGYLVFSGSSKVFANEMAEKLTPSLIFIKPLAPSAAGFEPCKAIHSLPHLKDVPIVILASLKGSLDPRYTTCFGIVDFLPLSFTPEELTRKVDTFLDLARSFSPQRGSEPFVEEPPAPPWKPSSSAGPLAEATDTAGQESNTALESSQNTQPAESARIEHHDVTDDMPVMAASSRRPASGRGIPASRRKKPSLLSPVMIAVLLVISIIIGAGLATYQYIPGVRESIRRLTGSAPPQPARTASKSAETLPAVPRESTQPRPATQPPEPPVEKPAPAAAPSTPAAVNPSYSVQVGAFKTGDASDSLVKKLQGKGYQAFAQSGVTRDKSPIIRVLVGRFEDRKAAVKLAREIEAKEQIRTTIFSD